MKNERLSFPLVTLAKGEDVALAQTVEAGLYAEHLLRSIDDSPGRQLEAVVEAAQEARQRLWWAGVRVAASVAYRRVAQSGASIEDAFQDSCVVVAECIQAWDYRRGTTFSTYVFQQVGHALVDAIPDHGSPASRGDRRAASSAARIRQQLGERGERLRTNEVAAMLGVSPRALERGATVQVPFQEGQLADPAAQTPFECIEDVGLSFLKLLSPLQQRLLRLHYGLDGPAMTLRQAARLLGMGNSSAWRLEQRALRLARNILTGELTAAVVDPRLSPVPPKAASFEASPTL